LWNYWGELLMRLCLHASHQALIYNNLTLQNELINTELEKYTSLVGVSVDDTSLLFVAGIGPNGGFTSVWEIDDGMVELPTFRTLNREGRREKWMKFREKYRRPTEAGGESSKKKNKLLPPIASYQKAGRMLAVDRDPSMPAKFAAELDTDYRVVLWTLQAVDEEHLARDPTGPANLFVMSGHEKTFLVLKHSSKVCAMKVMDDPDSEGAGGPAVLVGCDDGKILAWDAEGDDRGQVYAQMRSLTANEIILPVIMLFISSLQIMSFAFVDEVPWPVLVHRPARKAHRFVTLDFSPTVAGFESEISKTVDDIRQFNQKVLFYTRMQLVTGCMSIFLVLATIGCVQIINWIIYNLQDSRWFRSRWPTLILLGLCRCLRSCVELLAALVSTVLVVPMMKSCADLFHCKPHLYPGAMLAWTEDIDMTKIANGTDITDISVRCLEGQHLTMCVIMIFMLPVYIFTLLPFAAVGGDIQYVPRSTLFDGPRLWKRDSNWRAAAHRAATDLHMGILHPNPDYVFNTMCVELMAKISLPFITTLNVDNPLNELVCVSLVGLIGFMHSMRYPPYVEQKIVLLVQHLKLLILCCMLCGLFTVVLNDRTSFLSLIPLVLSFSVVLAHMVWRVYRTPFQTVNPQMHDLALIRQDVSQA